MSIMNTMSIIMDMNTIMIIIMNMPTGGPKLQ